jgi:hypothetical protein
MYDCPKLEKMFPPKWWQTKPECPTCPHRNDNHDMNCVECCPADRAAREKQRKSNGLITSAATGADK